MLEEIEMEIEMETEMKREMKREVHRCAVTKPVSKEKQKKQFFLFLGNPEEWSWVDLAKGLIYRGDFVGYKGEVLSNINKRARNKDSKYYQKDFKYDFQKLSRRDVKEYIQYLKELVGPGSKSNGESRELLDDTSTSVKDYCGVDIEVGDAVTKLGYGLDKHYKVVAIFDGVNGLGRVVIAPISGGRVSRTFRSCELVVVRVSEHVDLGKLDSMDAGEKEGFKRGFEPGDEIEFINITRFVTINLGVIPGDYGHIISTSNGIGSDRGPIVSITGKYVSRAKSMYAPKFWISYDNVRRVLTPREKRG